MLDSGQKDKALPVLQRALGAEPNSVRVKDALAAVTYDPEFWSDEVDRLADDADRFDDATCVRMLVRAARIVRIESPDDPRLEMLLKRIFAKDIDEPSANFMYETLLAAGSRWDELEAHQLRRADRAGEHGDRIETLRTFGLEWVQRFKDKDRGAKFFARRSRRPLEWRDADEVDHRGVHAAASGPRRSRRVDAVDRARRRGARKDSGRRRSACTSRSRRVTSRSTRLNDTDRAKKFFAIAASIEPQNPHVQDFVSAVGTRRLRRSRRGR